jgi:ADP-ribose diphosphatase
MPEKPIVHARRHVADTGIFTIEEMDLEFSNGASRKYQRIVGSDEGAVLVIPMLDSETMLLIREYAAGMERYELAFPKGHIEKGEQPVTAANREIQEETGYAARRLEQIASVTVAPGYLYHVTHIVLAEELYPSRIEGDEPEPIEVVPWRLSEASKLLERDDFTEARSFTALFMLQNRLADK